MGSPNKSFVRIHELSALIHAYEHLPFHQMVFGANQEQQHELQRSSKGVVRVCEVLKFHQRLLKAFYSKKEKKKSI